jgi:hypothetical protein
VPAKGRIKRPRDGLAVSNFVAILGPTVQGWQTIRRRSTRGQREDRAFNPGAGTATRPRVFPSAEDGLDLIRTTPDGGVRRESALLPGLPSNSCGGPKLVLPHALAQSERRWRHHMSGHLRRYPAWLWATKGGSLDALICEGVELKTDSLLGGPSLPTARRGSSSLAHFVAHIAGHRR